jgi:hypothetical protein
MADVVKRGISSRLWLVLASLLISAVAHAADLDRPYHRYRRPPPPPLGWLPPPPSCKIVPEPEMNLFNEVTRDGIQRVCISRGVYADSFWPYAPPYWRPNPGKSYDFP